MPVGPKFLEKNKAEKGLMSVGEQVQEKRGLP